ncbi:MAG: hypothetical protein PUJ09_06845 [Eubacteriales bacterium]|nr:hypothetical protein [Eubacteriales bacterium]
MKRVIVYFRYIIPAVFVIVIVAAAMFPNVAFVLENNQLEKRSLVAVMSDAWEQCREYLADPLVTKDGATTSFVWQTIAGLAVAVVTALASVGLSIWATVRSLKILRLPPDSSEASVLKTGLRRILPGRGWLLAAQLLIMVPVMFPYWLGIVYTNTLYLHTTAQSGLTWIAVVLSAVSFLLMFAARNIERELHLDVFTIYTSDEPKE